MPFDRQAASAPTAAARSGQPGPRPPAPRPDGQPALNRKQVLRQLSLRTGLSTPQVRGVLAVLGEITVEQLQFSGSFEVPGVCRFTIDRRPARRVVYRGLEKRLPERQVLRSTPVKKLRDLFFSYLD